jgi:hypothetical protein
MNTPHKNQFNSNQKKKQKRISSRDRKSLSPPEREKKARPLAPRTAPSTPRTRSPALVVLYGSFMIPLFPRPPDAYTIKPAHDFYAHTSKHHTCTTIQPVPVLHAIWPGFPFGKKESFWRLFLGVPVPLRFPTPVLSIPPDRMMDVDDG